MTSKTHLLTQLPRRTIKQELICSKASFVAVKLHLLTVYGRWSYFSIFRLFLGAIGESGMQGRVPGVHQETEEKQNYSLYYYRKKMYNLTLRSLKREKSSCTWHFPARAGSYCEKWVCAPILVPVSTCEQFSWHMKSSAAQTTPISPKPWSSNTAFTARVFICMTLQRRLL